MMTLGLNHTRFMAYLDGLTTDHRVRITGELLDLNHHVLGHLNGRIVSGQVDWDMDASGDEPNTVPVRTASVQVSDPGDALNLGTDGGPNAGAYYADRMVRLYYLAKSDQLNEWVAAPLITGPITKASRSDSGAVDLELQDKSALLSGPPNHLKTYPKGTRITDVVRDMAQRAGEAFMDLAPSAVRLVKPYAETSAQSVWQHMNQVARGLVGWRLTYDGTGHLVLKPDSSRSEYTVRGGTGGTLRSHPVLTFDTSAVRNMVVVTGGTPEGSKGVASATVYAPPTSPFNGDALGRSGVPRWLRTTVQDDTITSSAAALARAEAELAKALELAATCEVECLALPWLEPGDRVTVDAGEWRWTFPIRKATLPLDGSGTMTLGRTYAVRNALRPSHMPRKGNVRRSITTAPHKLPAKKPAKKATAKGQHTHKSTKATPHRTTTKRK